MTRPSWLIFNFIFYYLLLMLAMSFQSSLLHWFFGLKVSIQVVLVIITYQILHRNEVEALFFTYLGCYTLAISSTMRASVCIFVGTCLYISLRILKTRFYDVTNPVHFTWTAVASIMGFHIVLWLTTLFSESYSAKPHPLDWILETLLTSLVIKLLYNFFIWIDQKTGRITVSELN